jgi:cytochrome c-type biogenesis protein
MLMAMLLAVWLGILTSISPCPLASNIAALSFVTKELGKTRRALLVGGLYAFGRSVAYVLIAFVIVESLVAVPQLSLFLQTTVAKLLGPLLIVIGMFLLGLLSLPFKGLNPISQQTASGLQGKGLVGAFILGAVLALAFCPVSAALYFGSLIPLSVKHVSPFLLPAVYGIGTALPVLFFAVVVTLGTHSLARAFKAVTAIEVWGNRITGGLFILLGIYLSLVHVFEVL